MGSGTIVIFAYLGILLMPFLMFIAPTSQEVREGTFALLAGIAAIGSTVLLVHVFTFWGLLVIVLLHVIVGVYLSRHTRTGSRILRENGFTEEDDIRMVLERLHQTSHRHDDRWPDRRRRRR